jgi:hypothetical protein
VLQNHLLELCKLLEPVKKVPAKLYFLVRGDFYPLVVEYLVLLMAVLAMAVLLMAVLSMAVLELWELSALAFVAVVPFGQLVTRRQLDSSGTDWLM